MMALTLLVSAVLMNENVTVYPLVPPSAGQGWKLELVELTEPITSHYHKVKKQYALVAEGELKAFYGSETPMILHPGELFAIEPGVLHSVFPEGRMRFFSIDFPGYNYPEDFFYGEPETALKWSPILSEKTPPLEEKYFGPRREQEGYAVYEMVSKRATGGKWSVCLLEVKDSTSPFHHPELEHYIVVNGALDIEMEGQSHIVEMGGLFTIGPETIYQLKAADDHPVRVLCFSFPTQDKDLSS
jgi:mannose-6-phosphate isomerase-like protein (cupin superfamily)